MPTATREITIPSADGAIPAYLVMPAVTPAPAVVTFTGIYGLNDAALEWVHRFADAGFVSIAPDFFWRSIPGPLRQDDAGDQAKSKQRNAAHDREHGVRDIEAVRDYVTALPECTGRWGMAGYCFGGRFTLVAAAKLGAGAAVAFHPSRMDQELDLVPEIAVPFSFHCGGADPITPPELIATMTGLLKDNPRAMLGVYPGVVHGFTGRGRAAFNENAAETSFACALRALEALR